MMWSIRTITACKPATTHHIYCGPYIYSPYLSAYNTHRKCCGPYIHTHVYRLTTYNITYTLVHTFSHCLLACDTHHMLWSTGIALTFEKLRIANAQHGKNCVSSPAAKTTISTNLPKICPGHNRAGSQTAHRPF